MKDQQLDHEDYIDFRAPSLLGCIRVKVSNYFPKWFPFYEGCKFSQSISEIFYLLVPLLQRKVNKRFHTICSEF